MATQHLRKKIVLIGRRGKSLQSGQVATKWMPKTMTAFLFFPLLSSLFMPYAPFSPQPRGVFLAYETSPFSSP